MESHHELQGVLLSVLVASFAAYTAIELCRMAVAVRDRYRNRMLVGASLVLGLGTWSMHFVGMLALELPLALVYDPWLTLVSIGPVVVGALLALRLVMAERAGPLFIAGGTLSLASGIIAMHYTGMAAIPVVPPIRYDAAFVLLSITLALLVSRLSLALLRAIPTMPEVRLPWRLGTAILLGGGIATVHYVAMLAANFESGAYCVGAPLSGSSELWLTYSVAFASMALTVPALLGAQLGERIRAQRQLDLRMEKAMALLRQHVGLAPVPGESLTSPDRMEELAATIEVLSHERDKGQRELDAQRSAIATHAIVSVTDVHGVITDVSDSFCELSGYSREELVGNTHRLVNSGLHPPEFFAELWGTISQGRIWHGEIRNRNRNGDHYWVAATIVPLLDTHGLPERYMAIRNDITAGKAVEARLQEELGFSRQFIDAIPVPVYRCDRDGCFMDFNLAFEQLLGVRRREWMGRHAADLLGRTAHGESPHSVTDEISFRKPDGSIGDAMLRVATLRGPDGHSVGQVGTLVDMTARNQVERALRHAKQAADAASRAKGDFLANMSHEIRTPMNGVLGMLDLVLATDLTAEQRTFLQMVKTSADALVLIVNDILDFSKIEAGKLTMERMPVDLESVAWDTKKLLNAKAREKGIEIILDVRADPALQLLGDAGRLRQALVNIMGNAIKFTERGYVQLRVGVQRVAPAQALVRLDVTDTGIGIEPDKAATIFGAFVQADSSTTRRFGGTGLGLSITRQLAELMGGGITVESTPGKGSTFRMQVVLECLDQPRDEALAQGKRLAGWSIVFANELAPSREARVAALRAAGAQVLAGASMPEIRTLLDQTALVDLVILDALHHTDVELWMGTLGPVAAARQIPFVLMTDSLAWSDAARRQDYGMADSWLKPMSTSRLVEHILALLTPDADMGRAPSSPEPVPVKQARHAAIRRVLVVEDQPINQAVILHMLQAMGYSVVVASDGAQALEALREQSFGLVFMDMQMPVMDGLEATRRLRARESQLGLPRTPVVALTANAMPSDRQNCLEAGMDDYLAKPFRQDEVRQMAERYIEGAAGALQTTD